MGTRTETIETSTESDCVQWDMKCERVLDICPVLCYLMGSYDGMMLLYSPTPCLPKNISQNLYDFSSITQLH